ncbi:MAG: prenyltransferase/squalene oxidase repeat-containing protein, partial [Pseudomonadota bacterium]
AKVYAETLTRGYEYIKNNQVIDELPQREKYFRHACRGGWPFSDRAHGWPITDCTSEGLKCALAMEREVKDPIEESLLEDAVKLILSFQNPEGGWSTYELQRGGDWLERLNPSQVFGGIMVDYPYVECTSACIQALVAARKRFPGKFDAEIERAINAGAKFICGKQQADGGWEGSWAVCFTYGTWFSVWGLRAAGFPTDDPKIKSACQFLKSHQNVDGGWGEHYSSCIKGEYVAAEKSQTVHTAWALLTLLKAGEWNTDSVRKAVQFLINSQLENGDWPQESMVGVFNKTALINYENYRRIFPLWALSLYFNALGRESA